MEARYDGHADWYDQTFRRVARNRNSALVQADAGRLPLPDGGVPLVVMTFTHTDADDFSVVIGEASRVLRPGGRLVDVGLHPAYVGAFSDRSEEMDRRLLRRTAERFGEYDTNLRPWRTPSGDGRLVAWNVAVIARMYG